MVEKYESGITHPSEVYESFKSLDVFDREKFIRMMMDDADMMEEIKSNNILREDFVSELKNVK
mgnify:CR=1 FL=1